MNHEHVYMPFASEIDELIDHSSDLLRFVMSPRPNTVLASRVSSLVQASLDRYGHLIQPDAIVISPAEYKALLNASRKQKKQMAKDGVFYTSRSKRGRREARDAAREQRKRAACFKPLDRFK